MGNRTWTTEEIELLHREYSKSPKVAMLLPLFPNRTVNQIWCKAHHLGICRGSIGPQPPLQMSPTEASYLAGVLDCDGSITMHAAGRRWSSGAYCYRPKIAVYNTSESIFDWIKQHVPITSCGKVRHRPPTIGHKVIYSWQLLSLNKCASLLETVLPYLVIKVSQAVLLKQFCETRIAYKPYTKEDMNIIQQIKVLNHRGRQ